MRRILTCLTILLLGLGPAAVSHAQEPRSFLSAAELPAAAESGRASGAASSEPGAATASANSADIAATIQHAPSTAPAARGAAADTLTINQRRARRGLTDRNTLFVPKGQWIFGGTASYSTHSNNNYRFLIIEDINSRGYTFQVSALVAYSLHANMAVGARFSYSRSLLKLDKARLKFGDDESGFELSANNLYTLRHSYTTALIWRQYIPLGRNKRFALFNEMSLSAGASQSKFTNDMPVKGTYQTGFDLGLGISPGIVAFATNNMAVEINVGVMGINYSHRKQVHNQVHQGDLKTSMMNFKINIFSVGLGISFYL